MWGLIACHNYAPKYISYKIRKVCELIAELVPDNLVTAQKTQDKQQVNLIKQLQTYLKTSVDYETNLLTRLVNQETDTLLNLVNAQGVALSYGETLNLVGKPPKKQLLKI